MVDIDQECDGRRLRIKKRNGIYGLLPEGGCGKTFLYSVLIKLDMPNTVAITYSNNEIRMNSELSLVLERSIAYDLIYLDRADMYMTEELYKELVDISNNTTVVMDLKKRPEYTNNSLLVASVIYSAEGLILV
jgi:ABC-type oligopeptide transport system ATPase subunit